MTSLLPEDTHNNELLSQVHPPDWKNPIPADVYNLVAIGGGTAGIIAALGTAGLGGKSALIEKNLLGGDCLNFGCVPSKALLAAAKAVHQTRQGKEFGFAGSDAIAVDFGAVMERLRRLRASISHHDSAERFAGLGVDVHLGEARFIGPDEIEVAGQTLKFRRCVIATGGRATIPAIDGLQEAGYFTNETIFSLTDLPRRLAVIGGGPIGCELAQAFARLGSQVTLLQRGSRLLPRVVPEAAELLTNVLRREGIDVHVNAKLERVELIAEQAKRLHIRFLNGAARTIEVDAILLAAGRTPNVEGLNLSAAGVKFTPKGITVNGFLQTSNARVYATGDVIGQAQFTHAADAMSRIALQNAFFFGRKRLRDLVIPETTYTDPEIAHVGLTAEEAREQGLAIDTYREEMSRNDRAIVDGDTEGFAMIHCRRGTAQIVGGTIVARHAGEMIATLSLLMTHRLPLSKLATTIHSYPTQAEVLKRLADQYQKSRLTPGVAALLRAILRWR